MTRTISPSTAGTRTSARSTTRSRGSPPPAGTTRSSTSVPGGPLIRAEATSAGMPAIDLPSTATTRSPSSIPASSAGVFSRTLATRRPRLTSLTVRPTPENSPEVAAFSSSSCFGPEVVREAVVVALAELVDHATDRRALDRLRVDLSEVILLDQLARVFRRRILIRKHRGDGRHGQGEEGARQQAQREPA